MLMAEKALCPCSFVRKVMPLRTLLAQVTACSSPLKECRRRKSSAKNARCRGHDLPAVEPVCSTGKACEGRGQAVGNERALKTEVAQRRP